MKHGWARLCAAGILIAGAGITLAISWPGHLSYDSIVQLHDGRTGFYHSWHPSVMAWLLGLGDAILPGSGLFVIFNMALFFGALLSLLWIRSSVSWIAVVVAAAMMFLPQIVLYQAIVWKDVLFANAAVAGFVCLALAEAQWSKTARRFVLLTASFLLFALASLTRQNGIVVFAVGVGALGIVAWRKGNIASALLMSGLASIISLFVLVFSNMALEARSDHGQGPIAQLKLLRLYDIVGMVADDRSIKLERLDADAPDLGQMIRSDGVRLYTPQRNDTLVGSPALQSALADTEPETMKAQWFDLIRQHPLLYLKLRAIEFGWVFLTPEITVCRPVFVGVEGPAREMSDLGLVPRRSATDLALQRYAMGFVGTPFLSHGFYGVLALLLMVFLLRRRLPGDLAITAMLGAALVFSTSFFVISIACDYRYLYFLDLAVLSALFYAALDANYRFQVVATWSGSFWLFRSDARKS